MVPFEMPRWNYLIKRRFLIKVMTDEWIREISPYRVAVALITGITIGYFLQVVLVVFHHWLLAPLMFLCVGGGGILVFVLWMQHQPGLIRRDY